MHSSETYDIRIHKNILSNDTIKLLHSIIDNYFRNDIISWIANFDRPILQKYGNFVERTKGRFEIIPCPIIIKQVRSLLETNASFVQVNKDIKMFIKNNYHHEQVIEELCILPLEENANIGNWHRDVDILSSDIWAKQPFYITQVIYLDNLSDTEFCINSQTKSDDRDFLYDKVIFSSEPGSSVSFDGKIIHRGLANKTSQTRYAIYIAYHIASYVDKESIMEYADITL